MLAVYSRAERKYRPLPHDFNSDAFPTPLQRAIEIVADTTEVGSNERLRCRAAYFLVNRRWQDYYLSGKCTGDDAQYLSHQFWIGCNQEARGNGTVKTHWRMGLASSTSSSNSAFRQQMICNYSNKMRLYGSSTALIFAPSASDFCAVHTRKSNKIDPGRLPASSTGLPK